MHLRAPEIHLDGRAETESLNNRQRMIYKKCSSEKLKLEIETVNNFNLTSHDFYSITPNISSVSNPVNSL